jgi:large subunit ribosomal protein L21
LQTQNKIEILYSMYAIVSIAGQQFKVEKGKKVFVHRLPGVVGDEVNFDKVLLISRDEKTDVGAPYLPDAFVSAQILSHDRGDKVLVFKKKRRKGYQKLNGHRQDFTQILIGEISETGAPKRTEKKKAPVPKTEAPVVVAVEEAKTEEAATVKAAAKKPAAKTPVAKAPATKAPVAKAPAAKAKTEEKPKKTAPKKVVEKAEKPASKKAPAKGKAKE